MSDAGVTTPDTDVQPVVRVIPYQPHCFAFGGFEHQMLSAMQAVKNTGLDIKPLDLWSRDTDFDIVHVWGLANVHRHSIYYAKESGKSVVMTVLIPYLTINRIVRKTVSRLIGREREVRAMLQRVDTLVVVNDLQATAVRHQFGVPYEKIRTVPNIIDERYYAGKASHSTLLDLPSTYLLCVGNVCARKNQANLVRAAIQESVPLVLVGDVVAGEKEYGASIERLIENHDSIVWIKGLDYASSELIECYRRCAGFVLPSFIETQPISALEAAAMDKPLLLADRPYARQEFFSHALLVDPGSVAHIARGLGALMREPHAFQPDTGDLVRCRPEAVGSAYADIYRDLTR